MLLIPINPLDIKILTPKNYGSNRIKSQKISGVEFRVIFSEENNLGQFTK